MNFNKNARVFVTLSLCSAILTAPTLSSANSGTESAVSKNSTAVENVSKNPKAGLTTGK